MALQPRVPYASYARMSLEKLGDALRAGIVLADTQRQRLQTPDQQIRREGTDDRAEHAVILARRRDQVIGADESAGHEIVVAPEILGGAVQHEVDAVVERPHVERRGQRG